MPIYPSIFRSLDDAYEMDLLSSTGSTVNLSLASLDYLLRVRRKQIEIIDFLVLKTVCSLILQSQ